MGIIFRILLLQLILISGLFFSQGYTIKYDVQFRPKIDDTLKTKEVYNLKIDTENGKSLFIYENSIENNFNAVVFKDFKKNQFNVYEMILYKFYEKDFEKLNNWSLGNGTREILGYVCKEATISFGNRKWIAWYTTQIPIQDGPYKFSGLPGLILEIYSLDQDYFFSAIAIEKSSIAFNSMNALSLGNSEKEKKFKEQVIKQPAAQYIQSTMQDGLKVSASYNGKTIADKDIIETINGTFWDWMKAHDNPIEKGTIWIK